MKIIIVGIGKVGYAIAEQMTGENHDLVVIDRNNAVLDHVDSMLDVMCVEGNGASASVLLEAGVREADLLIAVSENDEVNLICCLMAKKLGAKHTVARVRNPEYFRDAPILRREIGLDMIINPENAAAQEISRILRVPSAFSVETFARGLVELIGFQTEEGDSLVGKSLIDYNRENPNSILMCAAKRGEEVIVPNGSFVPQTGDRVYVIGTPAETTRVLRSMGRAMAPIRRVSILGGSRIAQYLAWVLTDIGTHVTIVEKDEAKCLTLAEKLPKVTVIHGDGTNHDLLESEGIFHCDAFIAVTDRDEENLLMALTAKRYGVKKVVPKMSRMGYLDIVNLTGLDTVISPKAIIASQISSYVRGLANSQGSAGGEPALYPRWRDRGGRIHRDECHALSRPAAQRPAFSKRPARCGHRAQRPDGDPERPFPDPCGRPRDRGGEKALFAGPQRYSRLMCRLLAARKFYYEPKSYSQNRGRHSLYRGALYDPAAAAERVRRWC